MAKRKLPVILPPLKGGVNYSLDLISIDDDQAYFVKNCHIDEEGVASTRKGQRQLNSTAANSGAAITSIYDYRRPSGSTTATIRLVTAGKKLYSQNTTTGVLTKVADLNSSDRPTWCTGLAAGISYAVMANGTDFIKYDGTTVTNVDTGEDYPWSTGQPRYVIEYDNRVMAAGTDSDPYTVWVSDLLDITNWKSGAGSAAVFWTAKGAAGDRVTGLSTVYDFGVLFQKNSVSITTEGDPDSSTSQQITVCKDYGTTSHWSVQSVSNKLYFADESHIYKGILRAAVENGLEVTPIDKNILRKFAGVSNSSDISSVYDVEHKSIIWGIKEKGETYVNSAIVYNVALSEADPDGRDIWSGWFENASKSWNPYTLSIVITPTGATKVFTGDEDGYVYIMGEDNKFKDNSTDIPTEIRPKALMPYGMTKKKRARIFVPYLAQRYEGSTYVQWISNGARVYPSTTRYLRLRNLVPYWLDGTIDRQTQIWNNTIWNDRPIMPRQITVNTPFNYIQFLIKNDGSNARDEIHYSGAELHYQIDSLKRVV